MACENFIELALSKYYDRVKFHRLVKNFMIQGGDPSGSGKCGQSYYGKEFDCETDVKGSLNHSQRGLLAMANRGANTNGSQFYITFGRAPHLDGNHTVFGKMTAGFLVLDRIEKVETRDTEPV